MKQQLSNSFTPVRLEPRSGDPPPTVPPTPTFTRPSPLTPLPDVPHLGSNPLADTVILPPGGATQVSPLLDQLKQSLVKWTSQQASRRPFDLQTCHEDKSVPIVWRAATSCPDLFLLDAAAGPPRLQTILGLIRIARSQGQSLLILCGHTATADQLVQMILQANIGSVGRAIGTNERREQLHPKSLSRTATGIAQAEHEEARQKLLSRLDELELARHDWQHCERLQLALAENEAQQQQRISQMESRFADAIPASRWQKVDSVQGHQLKHQLEDAELRLKKCQWDIEEHQRLIDSPPAKGFGGLMKRLLGGTKTAPVEEVQLSLQKFCKQRLDIETEITQLQEGLAAMQVQEQAERSQLLQAFQAEQLQPLIDQQQCLEAELQHKMAIFAEHQIPAPSFLAHEEAMQQALIELDQRTKRRHPENNERPSIVVATPSAIGHDPFVIPPSHQPVIFQRMICVDAEDLTESAFLSPGILCESLTLVGSVDDVWDLVQSQPVRQQRTPFFLQLWNSMQESLSIKPDGRLIAELQAIPEHLQQTYYRESLLDQPDIELGFYESDDGHPVLAEVYFANTVSVLEAKKFLADELGICQIQTWGTPTWSHSESRISACWLPEYCSNTQPLLNVANGVVEMLQETGAGAMTVSLQFDPHQDWTEESAQEWLNAQTVTSPRTARYIA